MCLPLIMRAQNASTPQLTTEEKGIKWSVGLSWEQIRAKAKKESKYIFVDCFATWCKPCKKMDQNIYPNDTVGMFMNERFISVKVQMDSTKNDNPEVVRWYQMSNDLKRRYGVNAFPTFLFFSPNGEIVHKGVSGMNVKQFISLATEALIPEKQYFVLLNLYKQGKIEFKKLGEIAMLAERIHEDDLALQIATDYLHNYLDKLPDAEFCTKETFLFVDNFSKMITSKDRVFQYYYSQQKRVDSLTNLGYAKAMADRIITREEITPVVEVAKTNRNIPNWKKISKTIKRKYNGDYAHRNVLKVKPLFYKHMKDWKNYTKYLYQSVQEKGIENYKGGMGAFNLNSAAWAIFLYSNDKKMLRDALKWSERVLQLDSTSNQVPNYIDTKANLLFKLGMKDEAIKVQLKALALAPKSEGILDNLNKMKEDKATWIVGEEKNDQN